jgi:hypothetical protein
VQAGTAAEPGDMTQTKQYKLGCRMKDHKVTTVESGRPGPVQLCWALGGINIPAWVVGKRSTTRDERSWGGNRLRDILLRPVD